jgi:hypothetical protein
MLQSEIIDENVLEHVIRFHTEDDLELDGFELVNVERKGQKIKWKFKHEPEIDYIFIGVTIKARGLFGIKDAVRLMDDGIQLQKEDVLYINYTLRWEWYGRDGDDYVLLPGPATGAELRMEFCLCA